MARVLTKLINTYLGPLPSLISASDGRLHTTFNQTVASTGRLSTTNPNLQAIPIRTELGREIRSAFVAETGHRLISADYCQVELRILAHVSGEPKLREAFARNEDIHARTAAEVLGKDAGDADEGRAQRRQDGQLRDHLRDLVVRALGEPRDPARGGAGVHRHLPRAVPARPGLHPAHDRAGRARRLRDDAARPPAAGARDPGVEPADARARRAARGELGHAGHGRRHDQGGDDPHPRAAARGGARARGSCSRCTTSCCSRCPRRRRARSRSSCARRCAARTRSTRRSRSTSAPATTGTRPSRSRLIRTCAPGQCSKRPVRLPAAGGGRHAHSGESRRGGSARARSSVPRLRSSAWLVLLVGAARPAADTTAQSLPFARTGRTSGSSPRTTTGRACQASSAIAATTCTTATEVDPQTRARPARSRPSTSIANQTTHGFATGGVAEFHLTNPAVALNGSGTADAPNLVLTLDTTREDRHHGLLQPPRHRRLGGQRGQPVALQYARRIVGAATPTFRGLRRGRHDRAVLRHAGHAGQRHAPPQADDQPLVHVRDHDERRPENDEWTSASTTSSDTAPTSRRPTRRRSSPRTTPRTARSDVADELERHVTFSEPVAVERELPSRSPARRAARTRSRCQGGPTTYTLDPPTDFASARPAR